MSLDRFILDLLQITTRPIQSDPVQIYLYTTNFIFLSLQFNQNLLK